MNIDKSRIFFSLFLFLAMLALYAALSQKLWLMAWSKPFVVPALGLFFWFKTRGRDKAGQLPARTRFYTLAALFFSTLGDVLLLLEDGKTNTSYFVPGLTAFLCAHLFYIGAFRELRAGMPLRFESIWLPPLIYLMTMWYFLLPVLPSALVLPVILYSAILMFMLITVLSLHRYLSARAFRILLAGALLFVISDSLLAAFRFGLLSPQLPYDQLSVPGTYFAAQGLLVLGLVQVGRNLKREH